MLPDSPGQGHGTPSLPCSPIFGNLGAWKGTSFGLRLTATLGKSMAPHFVDWFVEARPTNVEFLTGSPWDSPTPLLRSPVAWVRAIFVQAAAGPRSTHTLNVKWFDEVEGVCSWQDTCSCGFLLHTFTYGLTNFLHHLAMLYQPLPQIAFVCHTDWNILHSDIDLTERAFACCPCGSWVQMFPLSKKLHELRPLPTTPKKQQKQTHLQLWFIAEGCAPLNCLFLFSLLMSMWLPPDSLFWLLPLQRHRAAVVQGWGIVCGAWTRRHLEFCEGTQVIQNNFQYTPCIFLSHVASTSWGTWFVSTGAGIRLVSNDAFVAPDFVCGPCSMQRWPHRVRWQTSARNYAPDPRSQGIPCGKGVAGRTPGAQSVCKWVDMGGSCLFLVLVVIWVLRQVLGVGNNARFKCKTFGLILDKHMGWMPLANFMYWEILPHMGSYTLPYLFLAGASIFPSAIFWFSAIICLDLLFKIRRVHICKDTNGFNIHAFRKKNKPGGIESVAAISMGHGAPVWPLPVVRTCRHRLGIGIALCGRLHLGRPSRPWTIQQRFLGSGRFLPLGWDTCPYCCWAFPVDKSIWLEDWDVDFFAFDWASDDEHRYGAIPAAQETAATPLTHTMLDLCSSDMEFPFSGSRTANLDGQPESYRQLIHLRPLPRWEINFYNEECWEAARTALWAGADLQVLWRIFSVKELEDWHEIRHLLPRCQELKQWNGLGIFFFERPHGSRCWIGMLRVPMNICNCSGWSLHTWKFVPKSWTWI